MSDNLLIRALISPETMGQLGLADWDRLIPAARQAGLLSRLESLLVHCTLLHEVPAPARAHLHSAGVIAANEARVMRWELNRLERALGEVDGEIVLLKGSAYLVADLSLAGGRISTDVDILVPKSGLAAIEGKLLEHGWRHVKIEEYDQYFYRHWSHELPPLMHWQRKTVVDVHHTILPPTGRLHPDSAKLLTASIPVSGTRFRVLAPADMVLHSAAHSFQDGDLTRGLRDLVDIDDLLRHFSAKDTHFWQRLVERAEELDLTRPCYYAIRYSRIHLQTPIPKDILDKTRCWGPLVLPSKLMDKVVERVITADPRHMDSTLRVMRKFLYIRAHWLRMPPYLLIPHLMRKTFRRNQIGGIL